MTKPPRPICFVVMPFGKKAPPGKKKPLIDFDRIYSFIEKGVAQSGLECIRADEEITGGFIHRPMFERLLLAEYVIADLTFSNANVAYEIGVRHGSGSKATLLISADIHMKELPFDLRPLRVNPYPLGKDCILSKNEGEKLLRIVKDWFENALKGTLPADNPILQVTATCKETGLGHNKADTFIQRVQFASEMGGKIHEALMIADKAEALKLLRSLEDDVLEVPQVVHQLYTVLMSIYIGYREIKAYEAMVALYKRLPPDLQREPVAIEQLSLALNRLAETCAKRGNLNKAGELRRRAQDKLREIPEDKKSCDTFGVKGRIHKASADEAFSAGNRQKGEAELQAAIETYEAGFRYDPRDFYPGVNAITLRVLRGARDDHRRIAELAPVVRFALERAPKPKDDMERYWVIASQVELFCALKNWEKAGRAFTELVAVDAKQWMHETTAKNLSLLKKAFSRDPKAKAHLEKMVAALNG